MSDEGMSEKRLKFYHDLLAEKADEIARLYEQRRREQEDCILLRAEIARLKPIVEAVANGNHQIRHDESLGTCAKNALRSEEKVPREVDPIHCVRLKTALNSIISILRHERTLHMKELATRDWSIEKLKLKLKAKAR